MPVLGGEMASQDICGRYCPAPEYMLSGSYMWEKQQSQYSMPMTRVPMEDSQCIDSMPIYNAGSFY